MADGTHVPERPPNRTWCEEHAAKRVELEFPNGTFVVTVMRGGENGEYELPDT